MKQQQSLRLSVHESTALPARRIHSDSRFQGERERKRGAGLKSRPPPDLQYAQEAEQAFEKPLNIVSSHYLCFIFPGQVQIIEEMKGKLKTVEQTFSDPAA